MLSPTVPKIRVRIPQTTKIFSLLYEKTKINEKEAGVGPFKRRQRLALADPLVLVVVGGDDRRPEDAGLRLHEGGAQDPG